MAAVLRGRAGCGQGHFEREESGFKAGLLMKREERTLRAVKHHLMRTELTLFHETSGSLRIAARSEDRKREDEGAPHAEVGGGA